MRIPNTTPPIFFFHFFILPFDAFLFWCRFILFFAVHLLFFVVVFIFYFLLLPNTHKLYYFQAYKRDTFCVCCCHVLQKEKCAFYVFTLVGVLCWEDSVYYFFMGFSFFLNNILFHFSKNSKNTQSYIFNMILYLS